MKFRMMCAATLAMAGLALQAEAAVTSGQKAYLERLYSQVLDRAADAEGMQYYLNALNNQVCTQQQAADLAASFFSSKEFTDKYFSLDAQLMKAYRAVFNRNWDLEGYTYWYPKLVANELTIAQLAAEFAKSSEFTNQHLEGYCRPDPTTTWPPVVVTDPKSCSYNGQTYTAGHRRAWDTGVRRPPAIGGFINRQIRNGVVYYICDKVTDHIWSRTTCQTNGAWSTPVEYIGDSSRQHIESPNEMDCRP
ncbi:DUF4214 domain-containing protein [Parachitinimonas caeni]|uniref:DUF4214 domain-containing protein n=1 Tax=Parachitinimonas caeni TaxID=3031301 RepID=A0ABT7E3Y4_9NEIS|nr:DUF4214 domain-containing protein [Parachitinimonas caeni]MDK2126115.1 DUF4214 domain-containing protein [Parachitinimonas caeni]